MFWSPASSLLQWISISWVETPSVFHFCFCFCMWIFQVDWIWPEVASDWVFSCFPSCFSHLLWALWLRSWVRKSAPFSCHRNSKIPKSRGIWVRYILLIKMMTFEFSATVPFSPPYSEKKSPLCGTEKSTLSLNNGLKWIWFINEKTEGGILLQKPHSL